MIQNNDDIQQVGTFIARLLYVGMERPQVVVLAYDFALSLEKTLAAERPGVPPRLPDYYLMRDASALLVESVEEAEKWLAAWKEQEAEEREAED
jgi:hypothetical protein